MSGTKQSLLSEVLKQMLGWQSPPSNPHSSELKFEFTSQRLSPIVEQFSHDNPEQGLASFSQPIENVLKIVS